MYILTYKINSNKLDEKVEILQINDIYNIFYESPLDITTDDYGYGYMEKDNEIIDLKIAFEGNEQDLSNFQNKVKRLLNLECFNIEEVCNDYSTFEFPSIHINEEWVLGLPEDTYENKNKINFIPQGAFGTGLHETTQDILRLILTELDLKNKSILDIGTGSGILAIASSIIGASSIIALDIRDVKDEVELNASLNELNNIEVLVGDVLSGEISINKKFDWIYINIGGEETQMFMPFIKNHLCNNGNILVSGLVEWSFKAVRNFIELNGFVMKSKHQTNEWITAIFQQK